MHGKENMKEKEEQRYGRNKSTTVDKSYLESGEFRNKFDRISDSQKLNKLLYQLAKKILLHRSGTRYEDMYWIDPMTNKVVAKEIDSFYEKKIVYSQQTRQEIKNYEGLITIHSHPDSFPPSVEDLNTNYKRGYSIGIVVTHDGKVFVYGSKEVTVQTEMRTVLRIS